MGGVPQRHISLPHLGLERVRWVRIVVDRAGTRYEVVGVGHRRPVVRSVPARTAAALLDAGVPAIRGPRAA